MTNPFSTGSGGAPSRSVFERLRNAARPDLATQALEQLLATRHPSAIAPADVERTLSDFGVAGPEVRRVRATMWRHAVRAFLSDNVLTAEEHAYLVALRELLGLAAGEAAAVFDELARPRYEAAVAEAVADGELTEVERARLATLADALDLPADARTATLERAARPVMGRVWREVAEDKHITPEEAARVRRAAQNLGVGLEPEQETALSLFERAAAHEKALEEAFNTYAALPQLPALEVPINLQRGEVCHFYYVTEWHEQRKERVYGQSFDKLTLIDRGTLYVTNRRVVFVGSEKTTALKYDAVVNLKLFADAILLNKASGKSPYLFISPAVALRLMALVLSRAISGSTQLADAPIPAQSLTSPPGSVPLAPRTPEQAPSRPEGQPLAEKSSQSTESVESLLAELDGLTGLAPVKREVASLVNLVRVRGMRRTAGLRVTPLSLHCVFTGAPGTGKTTVARLLARILKATGVLAKGQLIEVDRAELVGGYVGQTALKTDAVVQRALGGVLFVDEAYSLVQGERGESDYGREAIDTLLKLMEDHREEFIVIAAGYRDEMERFVGSNPGLKSRFTRFIDFPDYSPDELFAIFAGLAAASHYELSGEAAAAARSYFARAHAERGANFGNGRFVRNTFEQAVSRQADRLAASAAPSRVELCTLEASDVPTGGVTN